MKKDKEGGCELITSELLLLGKGSSHMGKECVRIAIAVPD